VEPQKGEPEDREIAQAAEQQAPDDEHLEPGVLERASLGTTWALFAKRLLPGLRLEKSLAASLAQRFLLCCWEDPLSWQILRSCSVGGKRAPS